jgi:hypothetical protein
MWNSQQSGVARVSFCWLMSVEQDRVAAPRPARSHIQQSPLDPCLLGGIAADPVGKDRLVYEADYVQGVTPILRWAFPLGHVPVDVEVGGQALLTLSQ